MRVIKKLTHYPPIDRIFAVLNREQDAVFLDSSLQGELGQHSIVAFQPYLKLEKGETFTVNGTPCEIPFEEYLRTYLQEHEEENETELPLVSGAVGYFSYDYGREKEGVVSRHEKEVSIPDCILTFYDCFIIEDHRKRELSLIANGYTGDAEIQMEVLTDLIQRCDQEEEQGYVGLPGSHNDLTDKKRIHAQQNPMKTIQNDENITTGVFGNSAADVSDNTTAIVSANFTARDYMDAVDHMIRYIVEGDIYVVNMTQQLQITAPCLPYEMFRILRRDNPSPFGGYLNYGDFQIVCASPERFLQMKNRKIKTRPIKGTRKRGSTPEEDLALKQELANSEKDQSELLMIVDLERNDLNRVCLPGSVQVTELFEVETYATVFHLIANVEGVLRPELNAVDLLQAAFPGGSITGAPKLRAMELIDQEEHSRRNLYTGSIGYLSLNGDCDLNIVIRTAVHKDGVYHIGVGGGITCESELEFEYEETWQKARALLRALNAKEPQN